MKKKMKKNKKKYGISLIACLVTLCLLLCGCAGGDATGNNGKGKKEASCLKISFHNVELDLAAPFEEMVGTAVKEGIPVLNYMYFRVYGEDGEYTDTKASDLITEDDFEKKNMMYVNKVEDGDGVMTVILLDSYTDNLRRLETSDGISHRTKEDDLPKEFVYLKSFNTAGSREKDIDNYTAVVVDGQYYSLEKRIEDLPETLSDDDIENIREVIFNLGKTGSTLTPLRVDYKMADDSWREYYESDEAFRNVCAIILELGDQLEAFKDGKIKNFGVISYSFIMGDMDSAMFAIVNPAED